MFAQAQAPAQTDERPPNIVFIFSDELAYFELGHMGNPYIRTPRIDRMVTEGVRFTHAYAGAPVCAPLRCNLMTGKHAGHASVRANDGGTPLRAGEETIASLLKAQGYATGGFGKVGLRGPRLDGRPRAARLRCVLRLLRPGARALVLSAVPGAQQRRGPLGGQTSAGAPGPATRTYAIFDAGLEFIQENKDAPFFCYLPITPPHGMYDIPADDPAWELYNDAEWMQDESLGQDVKNYAAMVEPGRPQRRSSARPAGGARPGGQHAW